MSEISGKYRTIAFLTRGTTGHLVLNQPPSNQMGPDFFRELGSVIEEIKDHGELKALVISGAGRHFSSGAVPDELIGLLAAQNEPDYSFFLDNIRHFEFFYNLPIPVISSIRGVCIGSAMEFSLFSHFRFSGEDAVFGLPESSFNLMPGIGGISHLVALAGKAKAMELVLRGNMFPAADALKYGLIDRILPKKVLLDQCFDFAEKISNNYSKEKKPLYLKRIDVSC